ncbi:MAG: PAS domain-containing sensor histidine kinase [Deltaproteobacteria bacterium]|jgi:signal transduction histidine kinase|nr:PAS domain-containing sensor histidine kinase [Deltaproteobacteria bacterium]
MPENRLVFKFAIAGQSPALGRLNKVIGSRALKVAMPEVRPTALLLRDGTLDPAYATPELAGLPVYRNAAELFAREPDLRLVLDTSAGGDYALELRAAAPPGVNLLSPSAVLFLCQAVEDELVTLDGGRRMRFLRHSFVALINKIEEEVLIMENSGKIVEVNTTFLNNRGGVREDYLGMHCRDVMGEAYCCNRDSGEACPWTLPPEMMANFSKVYSVQNASGQMEYFRVVFFPLPAAESETTRHSMFMRRNVTSTIQMEQRLQQSEKMAAIGELSTYIAHEIRNPLFAIGGFANALIRSSSLDESARDKAKVILEESQRLDGILKSIINFARPTEQDIIDMDVAAVLRQTVNLMGMADSDKHIKTVENIAASLPRARGNPDFLKQGLINIIKNAQEAMPDGGTLTISSAASGHMVEILVQDTGIGISKDKQSQIFSPFYSTKGKGSGLGLAMTKKIIEDMGGKLKLESEEGKGTTVRILLLPSLAVTSSSSLQVVRKPGQGTSITVKLPPGS